MKIYRIEKSIWVPRPLEEVFDFFSNAQNLEKLTPSWVNFKILTPLPIEMKKGALIDYQIKMYGIPMNWRTEITEWNPNQSFVDEQRRGPYRLWRHRHTFEENKGGTLLGDEVDYAPIGGELIHWLFVKSEVEKIFQYRAEKIQKLFE
ncbi:MAG: SRPBCC family protein [Deltaproteobacteria bacterium]|nr:SRPBCC family protein [Deltaproteobacteria bacterium]